MKKWSGSLTKKKSLLSKLLIINGAVMLALLILCSTLFLASVNRIMYRYINYDIDFFLTQMADNIDSKISYMENTILELRADEMVMSYLEHDRDESAELQKAFQRTVNISSEANLGSRSGPLVEAVFLFDDQGGYLSTCYYALTREDFSKKEQNAREACKLYRSLPDNSEFFREEESGFLSYPLLDEAMNVRGTVVFEINLPAVTSTMQEVENYEDSFWILASPTAVYESQGDKTDEKFAELTENREWNTPHYQEVGKKEYRIHEKELSLGMHVTIGIPGNQIRSILVESAVVYLAGIFVIALLGCIAFVFYSIRVTKPLTELTKRIDRVKTGDFETRLPEYDSIEFDEIGKGFNEMTAYINHLIKDGYEKQLAIQQLDLKFMQSQMNPHFMFNVLNTIALQSKMDGNENVYRMITSFSKLIQAKIYRKNHDKVRISEELEYVEYYLALQHFRYGDSLEYEICLADQELAQLYIPKLCIQILVENAVTHGLEPKTGQGRVAVRVYREAKHIIIEIEDDGIGFDEEGSTEITLPLKDSDEENKEKHNHIGLNNMNYIIRLMYGEQYGIKIHSVKGQGTTVRVKLPRDAKASERSVR